ncbi:MAG: Fe(3+) ABC transporter substrate-binding protein [Pseudomonadota bacterium]
MLKKTLIAALAVSIAAPALAAGEVNVYSYRQPELIKPLTDAFTEKTGIAVNSVFLKKGMVERLKAEGDRSPADLIFTVDISRLAGVVNAGVTQAVESDVLNTNIPAEMRDKGNHWFGLTARARIVYASKDRVAEGEVTTYEDLADPKWKGRICIRSGMNAYNLALTSAVIGHHGPETAKSWLEGVKANLARKPQGNDRAQVKAIWAGECDISVGNTYYMALMLKKDEQKGWADSVRIEFPTFSNGGTHMNISGMAMTKAAPNKENALKLMEFLASAEGQKIYSEINAEYPVLSSVKASDLVESWGAFTRDEMALTAIAANRPKAVELVEEVAFDE